MQATKVIAKPEVLVTASKGVTAEEAFTLATQKGMSVLSNEAVDKLLASGEWEKIKQALPCWSGTMVAYGKSGEKLGEAVEFEYAGLTWVFPVPAKFQGEKDAAISVNHPHFGIKKEGNRRIIVVDDEKNVKLTKTLPAEDGWYKTDANGIPTGEKVDSSLLDARHLYRTADPRVSPVARDFDGGRYVLLSAGRPSVSGWWLRESQPAKPARRKNWQLKENPAG